jgi:O-antigen ligase
VSLSTGVCVFAALVLAPLFGWALAEQNLIVLALLGVVALIPLVIRWPIVSTFGLYAFLVPFDSVAALSGSLTITLLAGLLAGGVMLTAGIVERRLVRPPLAALWWGLYVVWAIVSAAWAIKPALTLGSLRTLLSVYLLYLIAVSIKPARKELYFVCLLAVAGGMVAASAGYFFGVEESARGAVSRGTLVVGEQAANPNSLGAVLILPLALAAGGFVALRSPFQKLLAAGALGVIGAGVYITMSRGALLAIVLAMLVFAYRNRVRWQVFVPIALLVVVAIALPDVFFTRAGRVLSGEDTTGASRTQIWSAGWAALEHVGVIGAGFRNYTEIYGFSDGYSPGVWAKGAHNSYLETWVELGIVGLVLLVTAIACHFLAMRGIGRRSVHGVVLSALEAGAVGVLAGAFFADRLVSKAFWLVWILLAWAISNARENQDPSGGIG